MHGKSGAGEQGSVAKPLMLPKCFPELGVLLGGSYFDPFHFLLVLPNSLHGFNSV